MDACPRHVTLAYNIVDASRAKMNIGRTDLVDFTNYDRIRKR
jgi:hypothetical protein